MRRSAITAAILAALFTGSAALPATATAVTAAEADATSATESDIGDRLAALPGVKIVSVADKGGFPLYALTFTQPVDHRDPAKGTFEQRLTLWHKSTAAPVVFYTGGYALSSSTREITTLLDANQISVEHRFFGSSRPEQVDWKDLTIWQEATDEHRIVETLRTLYQAKWLGTGASKGGMTQVYHERFYPADLDAVVAYVAPNDAVNQDDHVYEEFFRTVGTPECRAALNAVQREMLVRREALLPRFEAAAAAKGYTFANLGGADRAYEFAVLDQVWNFWQSGKPENCATIPDPAAATDEELYTWVSANGLSIYADQRQGPAANGPYYHQAATQLGWADLKFRHLRDVRRYPDLYQPNSVLPEEMRGRHQALPMLDISTWVATRGRQMMFLYGQNDPWSAEKFTPSTFDSHLYVAPDTNHSTLLPKLTAEDRAAAEATIRRWAAS
ncbi:aminopeptidase [Streptomyces sp. TRM66268-LWL]|uniref:Aminopeptidase n=1 Tax=Streptomyces polyasparticus TaxID=2767826 RepID=A0ABR7SCX3_9ACTN|nr:S28 family serine protease [Streptomyces polyasparticus]MBC9713341.1 aminopeptidase [Streptomyces polyasparticus]